MPSFSAVASTNGLKEEPGCRSPCTARLNWLWWKLRPPGAPVLAVLDDPLLQHQAQHERPTFRRDARMRDRVVTARILRDARQERGLGQRQLQRVVTEVRSRRALDAICAVREVDGVQ